MKSLSKVCDAADWFDPEMVEIIQNELHETPYFHRKQWEFAMIFRALRQNGLLQPDKTGLSLGGGTERVLYAIARHVRQLIVTDLYEANTSWDCARTDDPSQLIRENAPFPVDLQNIRAMRMDMRQLDFADNSIDFCYSSCAVEHIGEYDDFLRHLNEVHRVLKPGGLYVFTTEFAFDDETIHESHNYVFSETYLQRLIGECRLVSVAQPNARITPNIANYPLPGNVNELWDFGSGEINRELSARLPHVQLIRGKHPLTSVLLILRKDDAAEKIPLHFPGKVESRQFMQTGIEQYRGWLNSKQMALNPFSGMGKSRFFADHADFFDKSAAIPANEDTVFHTDYSWLGNGNRVFEVRLTPEAKVFERETHLQIRVHRFATLNHKIIESVYETDLRIGDKPNHQLQFSLQLDDNYRYAILGKIIAGACRFSHISISCGGNLHLSSTAQPAIAHTNNGNH